MEILRDYTKGFGSRFTYKDELWTQLFHRKDALATLNCLPITCGQNCDGRHRGLEMRQSFVFVEEPERNHVGVHA